MVEGKKRSPGYPRIDLNRAVDLARRVHDSAYQNFVDTDTVLTLMGYGGKSGPSTAALASVKQYGLIEGRDQALRVTPLAVQILHPANELERLSALREAVLSPNFYGDIQRQFAGKVPADQVLKSYLIRNHGFKNRGADEFIRIFKENRPYMEFASTKQAASEIEPTVEPTKPKVLANFVARKSDEHDEDLPLGDEVYRFRVAPDCVVSIHFAGRVSRQAIEKTIKYLEMTRGNFPLE